MRIKTSPNKNVSNQTSESKVLNRQYKIIALREDFYRIVSLNSLYLDLDRKIINLNS